MTDGRKGVEKVGKKERRKGKGGRKLSKADQKARVDTRLPKSRGSDKQ